MLARVRHPVNPRGSVNRCKPAWGRETATAPIPGRGRRRTTKSLRHRSERHDNHNDDRTRPPGRARLHPPAPGRGDQEGFGKHPLEPHPTMRIEVRGQLVPPHRYSLIWAGCEVYEPKSAEQLAQLRASRENAKKGRE